MSHTPCTMSLLAAELFRKLPPQTLYINVFGADLIRGAGIKIDGGTDH